MTPNMIQLFSNALQVCLAHKFYVRRSRNESSQFMCIAIRHAMDAGELTGKEGNQAKKFLARWVRWQAHTLRICTTTIESIDCKVRHFSVLERKEWSDNGEGIAFYQRLIQRLEAKAAQRAAALSPHP